MGDNWDWDSIENDRLLPAGVYEFEVEDVEDGKSRSDKRMFTATLRVVDSRPNDYVGRVHFERYCIGTDTDPEAKDPETRAKSFAAKRFKDLVETSGATLDRDIDRTIASLRGRHVIGLIDVDGEFNRLKQVYKTGSQPLGLSATASTGGNAPPRPGTQRNTGGRPPVPAAAGNR